MSVFANITPRYDLYGPIHKALRAQLCDTLLRVGRVDVFDELDRRRACDQLTTLLAALRSHLAHEEDFIHPLLESLEAGSAAPVLGEHDDHREAIFELELLVSNLRATASPRVADSVYRRLACLVADNLSHMEVEESRVQELLWSRFTDAELAALNDRIIANIAPDEMGATLVWMLPALTPAQRAGMLGAMREQAPPPAFDAVVGIARAHLDPPAWIKLTRSLGLPAVPGLVTA